VQRTRFNHGWNVRPKANALADMVGGDTPWTSVELPHDAMLGTTRDPSAGAANGFFPGGSWEYAKSFRVPVEYPAERIFLEFEGVYRSALVFVNGSLAAHRPYGYSGFTARIDELVHLDEENTVRVEVTAGDDSRWYSGAGIYRNVHLVVGDLVHVALDGLRVITPDVDEGRAVVEVSTVVENDSTGPATRTVAVEIAGPSGAVVARGEAPVTTWPGRPQTVRQRILVPAPERWSADSPSLYSCAVVLRDGTVDGDRASTIFGIRSLQLDAERGLRINDEPVKLRGACVHHDNGVLGAVTIERAEERRVELLKAAGFNALRSAHNPMSVAMLDACDRIGMLVMDEAFDTWTEPKTTNDYARSFGEWWKEDLGAMVTKDFNHPSVILYSIGNEVQEVGRPDGARRGREMADYVRGLDPTRFVTNAINPVLACGSDLQAAPDAPPFPDVGVNALMTIMQEYLPRLLQSAVVGERLEESFAALDVAGYNYLETRYEMDGERYPHRIIVGTETMPPLIGRHWRLVRDNPHVIGDFTWTGWDYLGEAGIGRIVRGMAAHTGEGLLADYPWLTAGTGDLDITGFRCPA
jgi:beta-galactosidase